MDETKLKRRKRIPWLIGCTLAGAAYALVYSRSPANGMRSGTLASAAERSHWPEHVIAGMAVGLLVGVVLDCIFTVVDRRRNRSATKN